jgi:hypothetical protein
MKIFVTPSIYYFVSALLLSGVMLVPAYTPPTLALLLLVGGAVGLVGTIHHVVRLVQAARRNQDFTLGDWLAQIIGPVAAYALLVIAGAGFVTDQWTLAFMVAWMASITLMLCAIANTWSLVIWIVEQRKE